MCVSHNENQATIQYKHHRNQPQRKQLTANISPQVKGNFSTMDAKDIKEIE